MAAFNLKMGVVMPFVCGSRYASVSGFGGLLELDLIGIAYKARLQARAFMNPGFSRRVVIYLHVTGLISPP